MASSSYGRTAQQLGISTAALTATLVEVKKIPTTIQFFGISLTLSEHQGTKTTRAWELIVINKNKKEQVSLQYSEDKSSQLTLEKRLKDAGDSAESFIAFIDKLLEMGKPIVGKVDDNKAIFSKIALWIIEGRLTELERLSKNITATPDDARHLIATFNGTTEAAIDSSLAQDIANFTRLQEKASKQVERNTPVYDPSEAAFGFGLGF